MGPTSLVAIFSEFPYNLANKNEKFLFEKAAGAPVLAWAMHAGLLFLPLGSGVRPAPAPPVKFQNDGPAKLICGLILAKSRLGNNKDSILYFSRKSGEPPR